MSAIPKTHRALVATDSKSVEVKEKELPQLGDGDVLVQVKAVTLNPTDWKHVAGLLKQGDSTGSDFAGVVRKAAGGWKEGDRVAGFTRGGALDNANGAFAEYVRQPAPLLWRIPQQTSFEEAAAMGGIGSSTAVYCLCLKLGIPRWSSPSKEPVPFLIWSGATSVGHYAVQLAKILNLKAYVTASPKHHPMLKSLGAEQCFDYNDPDVAQKIKKASGGQIKLGLDTISEKGSTKMAQRCFSDQGGKLAILLPVEKQGEGWTENVQLEQCLIYAALKEKNKDDFEVIASWNKELPTLIEQGKFKSNSLKSNPGGLEGIAEGLDYLKSGKASGEKIAYSFG